jgi:hypothetical protein
MCDYKFGGGLSVLLAYPNYFKFIPLIGYNNCNFHDYFIGGY